MRHRILGVFVNARSREKMRDGEVWNMEDL